MASCDMCGRKEAPFKALVEEVELTVCESCSKFGKVLTTKRPAQKAPHTRHYPAKKEEQELLEFVGEDASLKIRQKREHLKLTQKEFAKMVNEKESVIHHIENNASHISLELARKLERMLDIQLVEKAKETVVEKAQKPEAFTLGDFIRVKK
jgi:putative transcription factor